MNEAASTPTEDGVAKNRYGVAVLTATLALTVFVTSLVLETRQSGSARARVTVDSLDAVQNTSTGLLGIYGIARTRVGRDEPGHGEAQGNQAALLLQKAERFYSAGNLEGAAQLLRAVLDLDENDARALEALGTLCFARQNYADAEKYLRLLVQFAPDDDGLLRMRLGVAQLRQAKYGPALENFRIVLTHEPNDGAVHFALACVYARMLDEDRALYHLERARAALGALLLAQISDPHLDTLRHNPRFQRIVNAIRRQYAGTPGVAAPAPSASSQ